MVVVLACGVFDGEWRVRAAGGLRRAVGRGRKRAPPPRGGGCGGVGGLARGTGCFFAPVPAKRRESCRAPGDGIETMRMLLGFLVFFLRRWAPVSPPALSGSEF